MPKLSCMMAVHRNGQRQTQEVHDYHQDINNNRTKLLTITTYSEKVLATSNELPFLPSLRIDFYQSCQTPGVEIKYILRILGIFACNRTEAFKIIMLFTEG